MITILASLVGFLSSVFPEMLKFFKDINDKKHELSIMQQQIEISKISNKAMLNEIFIAKDIKDQENLYSTYSTNITWVDALNGTVRPVLAYCFFLMYLIVKFMQYNTIKNSSFIVEYIDIIWNIDDQAIFAGIISFYFGQRNFRKILNR